MYIKNNIKKSMHINNINNLFFLENFHLRILKKKNVLKFEG